jgi:hydroxymethylbilane synthase
MGPLLRVSPVNSYAELENEGQVLWLRALVGKPDGSVILRAEGRAERGEAEQLGKSIAQALLDQGAAAILAEVYAT